MDIQPLEAGRNEEFRNCGSEPSSSPCPSTFNSLLTFRSARQGLQGGWPKRLAPVIVGLLLITAAALKTERLWSEPDPQFQRLVERPWFQILLIEAEMVLGTALLLQLWPRKTKRLAMACFTSFFVVAFSGAIHGIRSCACMGKVDVSPWAATGIDLMMLTLLLSWSAENGRLNGKSRVAFYFVVAGTACFLVPAGWYWNLSAATGHPLQITTANVEATNVAQGERRTIQLIMRNPNSGEVLVESVQSSCPCLHALDLPWLFAAGQEKTALLEVDLRQEKDFTGALQIEYAAKTTDAKLALHGFIRAQVAVANARKRVEGADAR